MMMMIMVNLHVRIYDECGFIWERKYREVALKEASNWRVPI